MYRVEVEMLRLLQLLKMVSSKTEKLKLNFSFLSKYALLHSISKHTIFQILWKFKAEILFGEMHIRAFIYFTYNLCKFICTCIYSMYSFRICKCIFIFVLYTFYIHSYAFYILNILFIYYIYVYIYSYILYVVQLNKSCCHNSKIFLIALSTLNHGKCQREVLLESNFPAS